jgi:hypothetical protein
MIRIGKPPYLECSSRGMRVFSAFSARPISLKGYSIEEAYQRMKVFEDGTTGLSVSEAKGRKPVNADECYAAYVDWWWEWIEQHNLGGLLTNATGLSDTFGQKGHVCQALVLWDIRELLLQQ